MAGAITADHIVVLEELEQLTDAFLREPSDITDVVDVAGGRPDQDKATEQFRNSDGGEHGDHSADGVCHQNGVSETQDVSDLC